MTMIKCKLLILILVFSFVANAQVESNTLYNDGEICTVVYGSSNITINNNNKYYLPEKSITELNDRIGVLLKKSNLLDERERSIFEKELNFKREAKNFEESLNQHQEKFIFYAQIVSKIDTNELLQKEELNELNKLIEDANRITKQAKCLIDDYEIETVNDLNGNPIFGIQTNKINNDPNFKIVFPFQNELARIKQYNKFGFIDKQEKIRIPIKYDQVYDFTCERALVGNETSEGFVYYFVDENNNKKSIDLIDAKPYINDIAWAKGYHLVQKGSINSSRWRKIDIAKEGLIDKNGRVLALDSAYTTNQTYAIFDSIKQVENDIWITKNYELYGILSKEGKLIHDPTFEQIGNLFDGYRRVQCQDKTWGYLNEANELYLRCLYSSAGNFENERAIISKVVESGEKFGVINKNGAEVIKPIFDNVKRNNSNFTVEIENQIFKINYEGACVGNRAKRRAYKNLFSEN